MKLKRFGKDYTFTRIAETAPANPTDIQTAYKKKVATESTFVERAKIMPARAYDIHSNEWVKLVEGGEEMLGIINVRLLLTTNVLVGDYITADGHKYKLTSREILDEYFIYEGHLKR